jgi:mRNA-degrading endonuclease RelE of RelBE toxin-antitoxin system
LRYRIELSPRAEEHLYALSAADRTLILDEIDRQLSYTPCVKTRNRKPMRPNPLAPWELRVGHLRVYYDATESPVPAVDVRAIGVKRRNRVWIGGKEFQL